MLPASEAAWRTAKERRPQIKNIKMGGLDESMAESRVDDAFGGGGVSVCLSVNRRHAVIDATTAIRMTAFTHLSYIYRMFSIQGR